MIEMRVASQHLFCLERPVVPFQLRVVYLRVCVNGRTSYDTIQRPRLRSFVCYSTVRARLPVVAGEGWLGVQSSDFYRLDFYLVLPDVLFQFHCYCGRASRSPAAALVAFYFLLLRFLSSCWRRSPREI